MPEEENFHPTFAIVWDANIGRGLEDGAYHEPVRLSFVSTIQAKDRAEVEEKILVYSDPSFTLRVDRVAELGEDMSDEELKALLKHAAVFNLREPAE